MNHRQLHIILLGSVLTFFSACSSPEGARTPEEFVRAYSAAWDDQDIEAILNMRVRKTFVDRSVPEDLTIPVEEYWYRLEQEEVQTSIERKDMFARAWATTRYDRHREHGDHIHVDVLVNGAGSSIVLIRDGEFLKIHPDPSSFP
jgi:hypothetical protein